MTATFTLTDTFDRTPALADQLYTIGVENPRTELNACSPFAYPPRSAIDDLFADTKPLLMAYDDEDGSLAGAVQFDADTGEIRHLINRYYLNPDGSYSEKGNSLIEAMVAAIRSRAASGRAVSLSPNPNDRDLAIELGLEFDA